MLGRFTLEAFDGLSVFDFTLVRAPDGKAIVLGPPSKTNGQLVSMAPNVRQDVIKMALDALGIENDSNNKAA